MRKVFTTFSLFNPSLKYLGQYSCKIFYPEDVLVGRDMNDKSQVKELNSIKNDDIVLGSDIGYNEENFSHLRRVMRIIKDERF